MQLIVAIAVANVILWILESWCREGGSRMIFPFSFYYILLYITFYRRLQAVQNTAAWLVSGVWRRDHIDLTTLHWLPVRVLFKITVLVYQCLNGQAPSYLTVSSSPISGRVDSVRLTLDFAPTDVAVPPTATGVLLPPAHECGTPCQPN